MKRVKIREPIWKDRSIGIAEFHFDDYKVIEVEIIYKKKDGKKLYPGVYVLSWAQASAYPIQYRGGYPLRLIPISSLRRA